MKAQRSEKELSSRQGIRGPALLHSSTGNSTSQYLILIEACNGVAVIEVKEEICQGCNMNIPPQLFVEIKKQEEMLNCPQCRRLLYYKNNSLSVLHTEICFRPSHPIRDTPFRHK